MNKTRIAVAVLDGFAALSAVFGGLMVVTGWPYQFPASWLQGTPFTDYLVPGLVLGLVVGGSATVATWLTAQGSPAGAYASMAAGVIMMGWIGGEILILARFTWLQPFYFVVGLTIALLGLRLTSGDDLETQWRARRTWS